MPCLSFLKKARPFFKSAIIASTSKVTVPVFAVGNNPLGPKIFASFPTSPIISGVATA